MPASSPSSAAGRLARRGDWVVTPAGRAIPGNPDESCGSRACEQAPWPIVITSWCWACPSRDCQPGWLASTRAGSSTCRSREARSRPSAVAAGLASAWSSPPPTAFGLVGVVLSPDQPADLWCSTSTQRRQHLVRVEQAPTTAFWPSSERAGHRLPWLRRSDPRTPDEKGLYADARGAYDWLRRSRQVPADHYRLRTLARRRAAHGTALHVPAAALVLEGAFTSDPGPWAELYWVAADPLDRHRSIREPDKIGRVAIPNC